MRVVTDKKSFSIKARRALVSTAFAFGLLFVCPVVILLPPRKLDLYTGALGCAWVISANHLYMEYRGPRPTLTAAEARLPTERAREIHRMMKEARKSSGTAPEKGPAKKGLAESLWMGDETEGWKERRITEHRKKLEEGKGYGGIIMDQIWDVWNWDKRGRKEDEAGKEDETGNKSG